MTNNFMSTYENQATDLCGMDNKYRSSDINESNSRHNYFLISLPLYM